MKAVFTFAFAAANALGPDGKCRVLALRGGGVHGAYEVGVLKAFTEFLDPIDINYDYISGVSIGALNTAVFAMYPPGQEKDAVNEMEDLFLNHPATNFWSFWPYYVIEPFYKKSFVDFSKFTTFLHEKMKGRPWLRKVSIQSVDLITGKVVIFDENLTPEIREKAVISSASIPFVFPPVEIDGMQLVDGGTFQSVDVGDPIERCREEVEDKDIIVDIVLSLSTVVKIDKWAKQETNWKDALSFYLRREKISGYYLYYEDVISVTRGFHDVFFRYILAPTKMPPSAGLVPINNSKESTKEEISIGYEDGKRAVEYAKWNHGSSLNQTLELLKKFDAQNK